MLSGAAYTSRATMVIWGRARRRVSSQAWASAQCGQPERV